MKFLISCVVVAVIVLSFNEYCVEAECCTDYRHISYSCGANICKSKICKDGTILEGSFCGHRGCNIFGCDCGGGCRDNSFGTWTEADRLFRESH